MATILSRQAKSFLVPDNGLYKRPPAHQIIPYMVRMSGLIRSTSMSNRTAAINMVQAGMYEAWAKIHRAMRPYFFTPIDSLLAAYPSEAMELPNLSDMPHIHQAMHFCLDVLVDLDRLTVLMQSAPDAQETADTVFSCWNAVYRATSRVEGLEKRIKSGKAFNGAV